MIVRGGKSIYGASVGILMLDARFPRIPQRSVRHVQPGLAKARGSQRGSALPKRAAALECEPSDPAGR